MWLSSGHRYYSQIGPESADPVTVFSAGHEEVSSERPGTPCVYLQPGPRFVRVLDGDKNNRGMIRSEGLRALGRYVMRRDAEVVWVLTVRSVVRKRHTLCPVVGDDWTFDTPFFWWQQPAGSVSGSPRLIGRVGPTKRLWFMMIEPGRDTPDVLAAVAFVHRKWWRW
jgi:hypothetical protein